MPSISENPTLNQLPDGGRRKARQNRPQEPDDGSHLRTLLILLDPLPPGIAVPDSVELALAVPWFLEPSAHRGAPR